MDNLTHSLVGLTAAKAGFEKLSPGATLLCVLAANAPDIDIVTLIFGGRWTFLQQHRGVSHSIAGTLVLSLLLPVTFWAIDFVQARIRHAAPSVKFKGLLLASIIVTATHPLLDWTNNYGLRPFLPWSARWFYGDFVFVIDPFIWLVLGGAAFLMTSNTRPRRVFWLILATLLSALVLLGTPGGEQLPHANVLRVLWIIALIAIVTLYYRHSDRKGVRVPITALSLVFVYCLTLAGIHAFALRRAETDARAIADSNSESLLRVAAMPMVADPTTWMVVMETDRAGYRFRSSVLMSGSVGQNAVRFEKPPGSETEIVARAEQDPRAKIFLGFARFPAMRVVPQDCATQTLVQFADLRYTEPGKGRGTFSLDVPVDCATDPAGRK